MFQADLVPLSRNMRAFFSPSVSRFRRRFLSCRSLVSTASIMRVIITVPLSPSDRVHKSVPIRFHSSYVTCDPEKNRTFRTREGSHHLWLLVGALHLHLAKYRPFGGEKKRSRGGGRSGEKNPELGSDAEVMRFLYTLATLEYFTNLVCRNNAVCTRYFAPWRAMFSIY